jgi:hypothetical protein
MKKDLIFSENDLTPYLSWSMDKAAMLARHILFQEEDKDNYIHTMLTTVSK